MIQNINKMENRWESRMVSPKEAEKAQSVQDGHCRERQTLKTLRPYPMEN